MSLNIEEKLKLNGINKKNKELLNKIMLFLDKKEILENHILITTNNNSFPSQFIEELLKINILSKQNYIFKKYVLIDWFCYDIKKNSTTFSITNITYLNNLKTRKNIDSFSNLLKYLSMKSVYQNFFDFLISIQDKETIISTKELYQLLEKELTYNSANFNKIIKNLKEDFEEIYPNFYIKIEKIHKGITEEKDICGCRKENISFKIKVQKKRNCFYY